jgi:hypothetical protein
VDLSVVLHCKSKAIPVTGYGGPYACETSRPLRLLDSRLGRFPVLVNVWDCVGPTAIMLLQGLCWLKSPVKSAIEPWNFRLVAQCFKQPRYRISSLLQFQISNALCKCSALNTLCSSLHASCSNVTSCGGPAWFHVGVPGLWSPGFTVTKQRFQSRWLLHGDTSGTACLLCPTSRLVSSREGSALNATCTHWFLSPYCPYPWMHFCGEAVPE